MSIQNPTKIQLIQFILGVEPDDIWGPASQKALDALVKKVTEIEHHGNASSFADPADVAAFNRCMALKHNEQECFKVGDNGIGCWQDDTTKGLWCALPKRDIVERWGSMDEGKHKQVMVTIKGLTHVLTVGDIMTPDLSSGAIIDLAPDSCKLWNLRPPVIVPVVWQWTV